MQEHNCKGEQVAGCVLACNVKNNTNDMIISQVLYITELISKQTCIIYRVLLTCHVEGEEVIN